MKKTLLAVLFLASICSAITLKPGITGGFNDTIKIGPFYDTANHILTSSLALANADVRLSKNGLKQTAMHGSIAPVYDTNGLWMVYLDSTDVSTIGRLRIDIYKLPAYAFSIMYTVGDTSSIRTTSIVASVSGSVGSVTGGATAAVQSQILANVVTDSNNILLMARAANLAADSLLILQRSKPTDTVPIKLTSHIALCDSVTKLDTVMRPRAGAASTGDTMAIKTTSIIASVTGGATSATQTTIYNAVKQDSLQNVTNAKALNLSADSLLIAYLRLAQTVDSNNILSRLSAGGYTAPDNAHILAAWDSLDAKMSSRTKPADSLIIKKSSIIAQNTGSVNSVVTGVVASTVTDKTGYALAANQHIAKCDTVDTLKHGGSGGGGGSGATPAQVDSVILAVGGPGPYGGSTGSGSKNVTINVKVSSVNRPGVSVQAFDTLSGLIGASTTDNYGNVVLHLNPGKYYPRLSQAALVQFSPCTLTVAHDTGVSYTGSPITPTAPSTGLQTVVIMPYSPGLVIDATAKITAVAIAPNQSIPPGSINLNPISATWVNGHFELYLAKTGQFRIQGFSGNYKFIDRTIVITSEDIKYLTAY
jgi:hypothetical protein